VLLLKFILLKLCTWILKYETTAQIAFELITGLLQSHPDNNDLWFT